MRRPFYTAAGLTGLVALLLLTKGYGEFLPAVHLAGRDLASNYAFTVLMQDNLVRGGIVRWSNRWLLGFPSFAVYPPLFFLTAAGLNLATGTALGALTAFKIVVFLSLLLLPPVTYLSFRHQVGDLPAAAAGVYMLYPLFVAPPTSLLYQALNGGLVAQGFAAVLLMPALGLSLRRSPRSGIIGGCLLGVTALAHPFVGLAGFTAAGVHAARHRTRRSLLPPVVGTLVVLPWLLAAAQYLPYLGTYTLGTARIGTLPVLIAPLALLGGYRGDAHRTLLVTAILLLGISAVDLPVVAQSVRFYTYAIAIGSVLAGVGAVRAARYLGAEHGRYNLVAAALLLPVLLLAVQAPSHQEWAFDGEPTKIYDELREQPHGRVLVTTDNRSKFTSFALQAMIPLKTEHWAVNDVHLDSSTSANYILTVEDWLSARPVSNPLCRSCDTERPPPAVVRQRLDDLGIRYLITRSPTGERFADRFMQQIAEDGRFTLYRLPENVSLVEPLDHKPVAVVGSWAEWRRVNDALFAANRSIPIAWLQSRPADPDRFSAVVRMEGRSADGVVDRVQDAAPAPAPGGQVTANVTERSIQVAAPDGVPVHVKVSYSPAHPGSTSAGPFNTVIAYPGPDGLIIGEK